MMPLRYGIYGSHPGMEPWAERRYGRTEGDAQRLAKDGKLLDVWVPVIILKDDTGQPIEITTTERDLVWLPSGRSPATK